MGSGSDLDIIGVLDATSSVMPHTDVDSPRLGPAQNSTRKQIEANYLARNFELSLFYGSAEQALFLNHTLSKSNLSSEQVTESAVVSTAVGNASGFITAIIAHYCFRNSYRTGEYQVQLKAEAPSEADKAKMNKNDIYIYLHEDKLSYFVKASSSELIPGQINDDNEDETEENRKALVQLKTVLRAGSAGGPFEIPPACKKAFLNITHKRRHTYSGRTSTNPLYRACKTLSAFGARLGAVVSAFIGSDNPSQRRIISFIMADIFCIVFGFFGIFYFVVRDKILKIPPNTKHKYDLTGLEGWSKYAKTALTFGTAVGQGIGGLFIGIANAAGSTAATVSSFSIAFWGGIVGVGSFVASIILVPLINWISSKFTRDGKGILTSENKNRFRNNYTRSGLTLGAGIGAALGLLIGNWCFGIIMTATVCSAIGAVIGAVALTVYGYKIHRKLHGPLPVGKTDNDEDLENSWDYATRCTASVFGFIGAAVVCAINPAMALLLVPIGSAIASALGWGLGLLIMKRARSLPGNQEEKKSLTMPWTQRITTGANIGSIIGGCIGLAVGFAGFVLAGPAGVIFAVSLFGAIGAVVGGICGALYDKDARKLIWQAINPWSRPPVDPPALPRQPSRRNLTTSPALGSTAKVLLERTAVALDETPLGRRAPLAPQTAKPPASYPPRLPLLRINSSSSSPSDHPAFFSTHEEKRLEPRKIEQDPLYNRAVAVHTPRMSRV